MGMSIDECIAYLENVAAEKKPRSRKARQIIKYLQELKAYREREDKEDEERALEIERDDWEREE